MASYASRATREEATVLNTQFQNLRGETDGNHEIASEYPISELESNYVPLESFIYIDHHLCISPLNNILIIVQINI